MRGPVKYFIPATAKTGACWVCGCTHRNPCPEGCGWAESTQRLCDNPICIGVAKKLQPVISSALHVVSYYSASKPVPIVVLERLSRATSAMVVKKAGAA